MKAGLIAGPRRRELVDMPEPTARPDHAVVAIERSGRSKVVVEPSS